MKTPLLQQARGTCTLHINEAELDDHRFDFDNSVLDVDMTLK